MVVNNWRSSLYFLYACTVSAWLISFKETKLPYAEILFQVTDFRIVREEPAPALEINYRSESITTCSAD